MTSTMILTLITCFIAINLSLNVFYLQSSPLVLHKTGVILHCILLISHSIALRCMEWSERVRALVFIISKLVEWFNSPMDGRAQPWINFSYEEAKSEIFKRTTLNRAEFSGSSVRVIRLGSSGNCYRVWVWNVIFLPTINPVTILRSDFVVIKNGSYLNPVRICTGQMISGFTLTRSAGHTCAIIQEWWMSNQGSPFNHGFFLGSIRWSG